MSVYKSVVSKGVELFMVCDKCGGAFTTGEIAAEVIGRGSTWYHLKCYPVSPQHEHDCSSCKFLGKLGTADLYYHVSPSGTTYIIRYSSDGPDYYSSPDFRDELYQSIERSIGFSPDTTPEDKELFLRRSTLIKHCTTGIINLLEK